MFARARTSRNSSDGEARQSTQRLRSGDMTIYRQYTTAETRAAELGGPDRRCYATKLALSELFLSTVTNLDAMLPRSTC